MKRQTKNGKEQQMNILCSYCGYYVSEQKLLSSASGGAASAISEAIIEKGGCVFGAAYSDDYYRVEYACAETVAELEKLKGSKYCATSKEIQIDGVSKNIYEVLGEKLEQGKIVLFIGLGCDVAAARKYCQIKAYSTENLYTIDLLCQGPVEAEVHRRYVEELEQKQKSKVINFNVRYKKQGWKPPFIRAVFENGAIFEKPFYESEYGLTFSGYSKAACYNCKFKGEKHTGDITIGDYWGLSEKMENWNKNGVSILFVSTPKGNELIKMLNKKNFHYAQADTLFALENNPMYFVSRQKPVDYDEFHCNLEAYGLSYAIMQSKIGTRYAFKKRIKKMIPHQMEKFLRKKC